MGSMASVTHDGPPSVVGDRWLARVDLSWPTCEVDTELLDGFHHVVRQERPKQTAPLLTEFSRCLPAW